MNTPFWRTVVPPASLLVLIVTLWEVGVHLTRTPAFLLPPPSGILAGAAEMSGPLWEGIVTTGGEALAGFTLSLVLGSTGAALFAGWPLLSRAAWPWAIFLQTVPIVSIAPLLVIWFGVGFKAVAVSSFIVSVFPVLASTTTGLTSTDPHLLDLMRVYGATRSQILWKLRVPTALPWFFTGLRTAAGLSVVGAVVGEMVAGTSGGAVGLGYLVISTYRQLKTAQLFAAIITSALLGLVLFGAVSFAGRWILKGWDPATRATA